MKSKRKIVPIDNTPKKRVVSKRISKRVTISDVIEVNVSKRKKLLVSK